MNAQKCDNRSFAFFFRCNHIFGWDIKSLCFYRLIINLDNMLDTFEIIYGYSRVHKNPINPILLKNKRYPQLSGTRHSASVIENAKFHNLSEISIDI